MSTQIFATEAPAYWDAGLPVIPLYEKTKKPALLDWSRFNNQMPTVQERQFFLQTQAEGNIGLALGPQSKLVMIDIDTDDEVLKKVITDLLPPSPWCRIGAKGMILAYEFTGTPTFRIKNIEGKTIVEHLSARTQIVLPPSIHPDTLKPYVQNTPLLSVLDQIVALPGDIETKLRVALEKAGVKLSQSGHTRVTDFVSVGSRDVTMTGVAGHYARGVSRGELSLVDAIARLRGWHATSVEKIAGDDVDIEKGVQNLIKFVMRDVEKGAVLPVGWDTGLEEQAKVDLNITLTSDQEEWDHERIKDFLKVLFETTMADSKGRMDGIDQALSKIATAKTLGAVNRDRLLRYIADASGMKLKIPVLKNRMKELEQEELAGLDHTEIAQAVIKDLEAIQPIAFHNMKFAGWNGSHWDGFSGGETPMPLEQMIKKMIAEQYGSLQAARRHSDHKGIQQIVSTLIPQQIRDVDAKGVNFANGVVLENLKLMAHDPSYGMTYTLPFRYMPDLAGKFPKFRDFLESCWGQDADYQQKVSALQEALCATIFGIASQYQKAFLLYGPGGSGKSTLLRIIECLVPDNGRSYCPPHMWSDKFMTVTMAKSVLNVCGELSDKSIIDGQSFKGIVAGEEMPLQYKGGQIFTARPMCAQWFASNHLPKSDDTSYGFIRRWLILSFTRIIPENEKVEQLGEIIAAEEREAIAAWAIEALPRLKEQHGFTQPASHKALIEEVANANNSVRHFLKESGMVRIGEAETECAEQKLHMAYFNFCLGPGSSRPFGAKAFRAKMRELAAELKFDSEMRVSPNGVGELWYRGLELKSLVRAA